MYYRLILRLLLFTSVFMHLNAFGGVLKVSRNKNRFKVIHPQMTLVIDCNRGGRISSMNIAGKELSGNSKNGFCLDHMKQNSWPGNLMNSPYSVKNIDIKAKKFSLTLTKNITSSTASGELKGLVLEKTYIIQSDFYCIKVIYKLKNTSKKLRQPSLWIQNVFSDKFKHFEYYRPTETGISRAVKKNNAYSGNEYTKPVSGWTAALIKDVDCGLLMLTDYNYTDQYYNCLRANSMEVFFDTIAVPAGKSWKTEIYLRPILGFKNISDANSSFVCGLTEGINNINLQIAALNSPKRRLKVGLKCSIFGQRQILGSISQNIKKMSFEAQEISTKLTEKSSRGILCKLLVKKRDIALFKSSIFVPASGSKAMEGFGSGYTVERKHKVQKVFTAASKRINNGKLEVLFVNGLFHNRWGVNKLAELLKADKVKNVYHLVPPNSPNMIGKLDYNPMRSLKELNRYDLVVLTNIPAGVISNNGLIFLKSFVEQGGTLLVLGGRFAYGAGGYRNTPLEKILPLRTKRNFDLIKLKNIPIVSFNGKASNSYVAWMHDLILKKGCKVIAKAGNKVFVAERKCGKGTVIACAGTVAGVLPEGKRFFCQTGRWPQFLTELLSQNYSK